jgi:glutathione S-transferase
VLRVFRLPFSTNVERVALACGHKGIEVEWRDVDPRDRAPVREVSGQDLVPVLVDGAEVVADSLAILRHLERRFPEPRLFPAEPARRAELEIFLDWFDRVWKRPPNELEAERASAEPSPERIAALGAAVRGSLQRFEDLLDGRAYLFGDFSAADCVAFPFLKYALDETPGDDEPFHAILREHLRLGGGFGRLRAWIARVDGRPRA